jgi:hypothetical protein
VTGLPAGHVGGIPIEEVLGFYGPALLLAAGAAGASISARLRRLRGRLGRLR